METEQKHIDNVHKIINIGRQRGNTTWLLRAAIKQPNVMIVCRNQTSVAEMTKSYKKLLQKEPWYKKFWWWCFGRSNPKFVTVNNPDNLRGINFPTVFDNGAIY